MLKESCPRSVRVLVCVEYNIRFVCWGWRCGRESQCPDRKWCQSSCVPEVVLWAGSPDVSIAAVVPNQKKKKSAQDFFYPLVID